MKPSDRYLKIVEWSEEDGCYVGTCPGLMLGGVHGADEAKVYKELCQAVEDYRNGLGGFSDCYIGRANHAAGADTTLTFDKGLKGNPRFTVL